MISPTQINNICATFVRWWGDLQVVKTNIKLLYFIQKAQNKTGFISPNKSTALKYRQD